MINKKNIALIVIDVQEDFTRGALRNEEAIKALPVIHEIVEYAKEHFKYPIYYTFDTHSEDYLETQEGKNLPVPHCIQGTPGYQICPEAMEPEEDNLNKVCIWKETFGYIDWFEREVLRDADEIWMCGFCTDICVSANFQILKATFPEVPITIISDGCAGVTPELHEAALKVMKSCQAKVVKWEDIN